MGTEKHTIINGPFTEVFKNYDNKERRHIYSLISRHYVLYNLPNRNSAQNKEMKALVWVINLLQEIENDDDQQKET